MNSTEKNKETHHVPSQGQNETAGTMKRKPWWRRCAKIAAWVLGSLVALLVILMCLVAWILTPERLTPLVEKYGSRYLKADVKVERVELTVWSSFPSVELDVRGLQLTSHALAGQPDSGLQACGANASRLLDAESLHGSINPWALLSGTISLGDISATGLCLNLVSYAPGISNYDIVPPSEEKKEKSEPWELRFRDINLSGGGFVRYCDVQSGVDVRIDNPSLRIRPTDADCGKLMTHLGGRLSLAMAHESYVKRWPFTLEGPVEWNLKTMDFSLSDYSIELALFKAKLNASLSAGEHPRLNHCTLQLEPVQVARLLSVLPQQLQDEYPAIKRIDTDMGIAIKAEVACPWRFDAPALPSVKVDMDIPRCSFTWLDETGKALLALSDITMQAALEYNGAAPELSRVSVPVFNVSGDGIRLNMDARVDELLGENPLVTFASRGTLDLSALSELLPSGGSLLGGNVEADAEVKGRLEDIMALRYEKFEANGSVQIRDLVCNLPSMAMRMYSRVAKLMFGNALTDMGPRVPGTLLARAEIDTLSYIGAGISVGLRNATLRAGASDKLLSQSASSKEITPMGMEFKAASVRMESEADTTKVKASNMQGTGSLTRYEGNVTAPLLKAALSADKLRYSDPTMRLRMKEFAADVSVHPRKRKAKGKNRTTPRTVQEHVIRMDMDQGIKDMLKEWGISGNLRSDNVRLTHLMYPVPVNISSLDFDFSLDSVRLHRARIQSQKNALTLAGEISNLRRFMLGRTRRPLRVRLRASIDSLDLNQVIFNSMLGTAMSEQRGRLAKLSVDEQEAIVRAAASIDTVQSLSSDSLPLIIPRNIDAIVNLKAANAVYGDIDLYNLRADLIVNDGAASVDSLQASTDFGNAYLNLLYSSRNPELLNLAVDLGFSDIDLHNFFTTFPQIAATAPAITDLSGMVGARLVGSMGMYPNMEIDFNSLNAVLNITGSQLRLEQSPLIRKVARMMLIRKKGALEITDMDIQLALHDNVLRLYPFKFGMEKYRFALLGENDMSENMFYHLSVLKSPIPFKFGINVKGTFDKPKLRFGGAKYKENEAQEMVSLIDTQRVNFVHAMRLELRRLINKAALSYSDSPQYKAYGLDKELKKNAGDDNDADDSNFSSPAEMLTSSLKAPLIKALGSDTSLETLKNVSKPAPQAKDKKKKKKK